MAKIDKRIAGGGRTHQIGPTLFTAKIIRFSDDEQALYYEAWRLRSDGDVQSRIIRTTDLDANGETIRVNKHRGSAFRSVGKITHGPNINIDFLRAWLRSRHYSIKKEMH